MSRLDWQPILEHAAAIVDGYDTGVTLRQCFYRLVSDGTLPNTTSAYKGLSARTAEARRDGWFPEFIDNVRQIHRYRTFDGPDDARGWLARIYRRDRTEGQPFSVYLAVEKRGIVAQLESWFGDLGVPILSLGGYSSQTYVTDVFTDVGDGGRPAVLLYAGDFDPSGEDIDRDFIARSNCWDKVVRVALTPAQIDAYGLPPQPGKATDSRAAAFTARHGELVQVELDALPPDVLRGLYDEALTAYWDTSAFEEAVAREEGDLQALGDQ
jgi:hypothetical protein